MNANIQIPCDVNSGIQPEIIWKKNNSPLVQTTRVRVLFNNTLAIDNANADDSGNYKCFANNGYDVAEDYVNILVSDTQVR